MKSGIATIAATVCFGFYGMAQAAGNDNTIRLATVNDTTYNITYTPTNDSKFAEITAIVNDETVKRTLISGLTSEITATGNDCRIILGVDTVSMPLADLPENLRIGSQFMVPNSTGEVYTSNFSVVPDRPCRFHSEIYVPNMDLEWMMPILRKKIYSGIMQTGLLGNSEAYTAQYKFMSAKTLTDLTVSAAKLFETAYRMEYTGQPMIPSYEFFIQIIPVWQSSDLSLLTFFVNMSYYTGGAHGMYENYYVTFNTGNHKTLGIAAFVVWLIGEYQPLACQCRARICFPLARFIVCGQFECRVCVYGG